MVRLAGGIPGPAFGPFQFHSQFRSSGKTSYSFVQSVCTDRSHDSTPRWLRGGRYVVGISYSDFRVATGHGREALGGVGRRLQLAAVDGQGALDERQPTARSDALAEGLLAVGGNV